jgi:TIR domain/Domain of unknown function (DUF4384)
MPASPAIERKYDVFISYSHLDRSWVVHELLPALESAGLSVIIDYRDFTPGVPAFTNMERALQSSRHTLVVLTPRWVKSQWTEFEGLLLGMSDPSARKRKLIPLLLEDCEVPPRIGILTHADLRASSQRVAELHRVIQSLLENRVVLSGAEPRQAPPAALKPKWPWFLGAAAICSLLLIGILPRIQRMPAPHKPGPVPFTVELDYSITVQRFKDGKPFREPFQLSKEMVFEDGYRIALNLRTPKPGYLYVLNEGPSGGLASTINEIYPGPGRSALIPANTAVRIPTSAWIVFDAEQGTEKMYLVFSAEPVADIERVKNNAAIIVNGHLLLRDPSQIAELQKVLGKLQEKPVQIAIDERLQQTSLRSGGTIMHLIRLEHH